MNIENIITVIGIPTIIGTLIYVGRKLEVLDNLKKATENILERLNKVDTSIKDIDKRLTRVEDRIDMQWKDKVAPSGSPRQLNELGNKILNESGIKEIVENNKDKLLTAVKAIKPTNAYDAEEAALKVVSELPKLCPDVIPKLKDGAFKVGQGIDAVLLVGGFTYGI